MSRFYAPPEENLIMSEKMDRVREAFIGTNYMPYLCLFNAVFDVDFEKTPHYQRMNTAQKYKALQEVFKVFASKVNFAFL